MEVCTTCVFEWEGVEVVPDCRSIHVMGARVTKNWELLEWGSPLLAMDWNIGQDGRSAVDNGQCMGGGRWTTGGGGGGISLYAWGVQRQNYCIGGTTWVHACERSNGSSVWQCVDVQ